MSVPRRLSFTRLTAGLLVLALVVVQWACHSWYPVPAGDLSKESRDHALELTYADGVVVLQEPYQLDYPRVTAKVSRVSGRPMGYEPGVPAAASAPIATFDLERAQLVRIQKVDPWKTTGVAVGVPVGVVLVILATKQSCPFVFVDEGQGETLAGEGYPSAIYRSLEREDLLQLPVAGQGPLRLRLANLVDETQVTKDLGLVTVDHRAGTRVLATATNGLVLVGPALPPAACRDVSGRDCLEQVRAQGGNVWTSDLRDATRQRETRFRDGLTATFERVPERPVLEVQLRSNRWLEVVTGRFFAAMGDRFPAYLEQANAAEAAPILEWRRREGVDLRVEALHQGRWQTVGHLYPTGAAVSRRLALPLPVAFAGATPLQVRLSGGTGFWSVDAVGLASESADPLQARAAPFTSALAQDGSDQRAALSGLDGRAHVMERPGEEVDVRFDLPAVPGGLTRTTFLRIRGYYNPHDPALPNKDLPALYRMQQDEGSFSRFGLAFYRDQLSLAHGALQR